MAVEHHIASLVVHCRPTCVARLETAIAGLRGADVPASDPSGKLIVTIEDKNEQAIAERLNEISAAPGVLSATLVFHHVEPGDPGGGGR